VAPAAVAVERPAARGLVHDAVLDAARAQRLTPLGLVVAAVGVDGGLVAEDEVVGGDAVVDVGRGEQRFADEARALVGGDMGFVAVGVLLGIVAHGPRRVGV